MLPIFSRIDVATSSWPRCLPVSKEKLYFCREKIKNEPNNVYVKGELSTRLDTMRAEVAQSMFAGQETQEEVAEETPVESEQQVG